MKKILFSYISVFGSIMFSTLTVKKTDNWEQIASEQIKDGKEFHLENELPLDRTVLVVYDNHTLGYIIPELDNSVQVLHCSPLKGYPHTTPIGSFSINHNSNLRISTPNDFDEFRVSFEGFNNPELYEYQS